MADQNVPIYLRDSNDELVQVGWSTPPDENSSGSVTLFASGPGKEVYDWVSRGAAQGFVYGEPVVTPTPEENKENN